jgi:hypothetical protein
VTQKHLRADYAPSLIRLVDLVDKTYGSGHLELVEVADITADGAFDEALKGVQGLIHAAR